MLGTCQHLKEAHKDTTSAWAATVTATTGVAESLGWWQGQRQGSISGGSPILLPSAAGQGALRGLQESGCHSGCAGFGEEAALAQPWGRDQLQTLLRAEGNLAGSILWRVEHEDVSLHSVVLRGLAWLMICPLIFHGVCVCFLSLTFSESLSCFD